MHAEAWHDLRGTPFLDDIFFGNTEVEQFWIREIEKAVEGGDQLHTWDYQWALNCWAHSGLSIFPRHNLVSNVGYGEGATHFEGEAADTMELPTSEIALPLDHPPRVTRNVALDRRYVREILEPHPRPWEPPQSSRLRRVVRRAIPPAARQPLRRLFPG